MNEFIKEIFNGEKYTDYDEASTKQFIILPILQMLGWGIFSRSEVYPEYPLGKKRIDFALIIEGNVKVLLEIKRFGLDLTNYSKQLLEYAFSSGVELACLTNGLQWQFFLPMQKCEWEERKFLEINFNGIDDQLNVKLIYDLLSKNNVVSGESHIIATRQHENLNKDQILNDILPDILLSMFNSFDEEFLNFIISKLKKIT